jgi:L-malate glycosyltransferase
VNVATCAGHMPIRPEDLADEVTVHELPFRAPKGYFINGPHLRRLIRQLRPDLVHAHFASGYGTLGTFVGKRPKVLSVWGTDVYRFPEKSWAHRHLIGRNLRSYDAITSTSHVMRRRTLDRWPDITDRSTVIPFGVDLEMFAPTENVVRAGNDQTLRIGICKSLRPKYGIDTLVRAFALAVKSEEGSKRAELRIAGDGPQRGEIEQLVRTLGIEDETTILGALPHSDVPRFLHDLDIFCALSEDDSESFGVAVVEAMATALPTVVSDVDGFEEVTTSETSIVVPRNDPAAAACALRSLLNSPGDRRRLGLAGRERVVQEYNWDQNVHTMINRYRSLVDAANYCD